MDATTGAAITNQPGPVIAAPAVDSGVAAPTKPVVGGSVDTQWCKVKTLLDKKCGSCHGAPPSSGAPFPLVTHADYVAAHPTKAGKKVYERVGVRIHFDKSKAENMGVMPPGAEMPAADRALIDTWIAAGAPAGENPTCTPPAGSASADAGAPAPEVWPLPECDAVYKITSHGPGGVDTPNMAPPGVESHPQVPWDAPWGDEDVQAIAFKTITDNKDVLHHWILSGRPGGFLTGWAPGEDGIRKMTADVGMLMPKGRGSLNLDMHYFNTMGTVAKPDKSGVEVCVVKKAKFRKNNAAVTMGLMVLPDVPANSTNVANTSTCTVTGNTPITLLSASPHAHTYATHMKFTVKKKKDGTIVNMHDMPFMFGEQKSYPLDPPVVVENGDVITTTCTYTNKTSRSVGFGENTGNEMCFNFAMYYPAGALTCGGLFGGGGGFIGL